MHTRHPRRPVPGSRTDQDALWVTLTERVMAEARRVVSVRRSYPTCEHCGESAVWFVVQDAWRQDHGIRNYEATAKLLCPSLRPKE